MSDTKTASNYIDGSILRTEIKNYKHLLKSKIPQNRYFAETARYRAESVLERFVDGDLQLEPKDYDTMENTSSPFAKSAAKPLTNWDTMLLSASTSSVRNNVTLTPMLLTYHVCSKNKSIGQISLRQLV